jgi:hypothetical protein
MTTSVGGLAVQLSHAFMLLLLVTSVAAEPVPVSCIADFIGYCTIIELLETFSR